MSLRSGWFRRATMLVVVAAGARAAEAQGTVEVRGVVRDREGAVIERAEVLIEGTARSTRTGADGAYVLQNVPAGAVRLLARRLGFRVLRRDILGVAGTQLRIDWALERTVATVDAILVTGRREPSDGRLAGFRARSQNSAGGHFITRTRIEQSANRNTLDVLRGIAGVRILSVGRTDQKTVRMRGARCPPLVFLDGFPAIGGEFDLESIDLHMTEGIEVYPSSSSVPPEFLGPRGMEQCGVIAIWSRPTQPRVRRPREPVRGDSAAAVAVRAAAFAVAQVDEAAHLVGTPPDIAYPDSLFEARVAGEATLEFVVGADGVVDWRTLRVVSATHPKFAEALRTALAGLRWRPALRDGKPVAQLVVVPAQFQREGGSVDQGSGGDRPAVRGRLLL